MGEGSQTILVGRLLVPVLKMGGAGDPPASVGDPSTGIAAVNVAKRPCPLARTAAPVPSGESPDGTGGSPVLPANYFPNTLLACLSRELLGGRETINFILLFSHLLDVIIVHLGAKITRHASL